MSDNVPERPALDPADVAGRSFRKTRKGFEPVDVRSALGLAADALRVWQERDLRLQARIEQLEAALEAANVLTDDRVASLLGTEAVKVIQAAREAADEIRRRAEADAADAAAAVRAELADEAELARNETEQLRAEVLKAAEAELASARRRGREMVAEARAVRERMLRDLAERRRTARRQIAAAQAGRDHVLEALRSAGLAVDGVTITLSDLDRDTARLAERAALSIEDDVDQFVEVVRQRLGDTDAEETTASPLESPADDAAPVAVELVSVDETEAVALVDESGPTADASSSDTDTHTDTDVVVELVVPTDDDEYDDPQVDGGLALAGVRSDLAAARRTVGTDAEVIDFSTAARRPAAAFLADSVESFNDDLDDDFDD
ncbi:MAG: hypothetical protein ACKOYM_06235, partial [Actinomycetes bacterium]